MLTNIENSNLALDKNNKIIQLLQETFEVTFYADNLTLTKLNFSEKDRKAKCQYYQL